MKTNNSFKTVCKIVFVDVLNYIIQSSYPTAANDGVQNGWRYNHIVNNSLIKKVFVCFVVSLLLSIVFSPLLHAQSYRASASNGVTSGVLSLAINKPTGTLSGDLMIATISVRPSSATITTPSGWTLILRTNNASGVTSSQATYWKVAGSSEPASYTFNFSTSTGSAGGIMSFYNVNITAPVNVFGGQSNASALTHATPSVTTTVANTMLVTAHSFVSCATWTPPTGMTESVDKSSDAVPLVTGISMEMNYVTQASAAATGTKTATASNDADIGVGQIVALAPASNGQWTGAVSTNWATSGNWSNSVVPTSAIDVVIPANVTQPTISSSVSCKGLTINSGATLTTSSAGTLNITGNITNSGTMTNTGITNFNGTLQQTFSGVTIFNTITLNNAAGLLLGGVITVNGDLTITAGTLNTNSYNITLTGNFTNNGGFTAGTTTITFTGSGSNTITGSSTTAFNNVTVNKGTNATSILDVQSLITIASGGLTLTNGTFKLSSASTITPFTVDITAAPYLIPSSAGLWVNGGTVSTTSNVTCFGLIQASNGTLNIGDGSDERIRAGNGANLIIDGGVVNLAGRLSYTATTDAITFNMSAGTVNAGTVGTTNIIASFTIVNSASSFTMSGGTIVIVRGSTSNVGYSNAATTSTVTGGTLQMGNSSTPATDTMQINSTPSISNLTINSFNAPVVQLAVALVVNNTVTISGGKLLSNNFNLSVGGNWVNSGTFIVGSATVTFNGTSSQTIGGTTFNNLTINNSSGVTLTADVTYNAVLTLTSGVITTGAYTIIAPSGASVSRTSGHVFGNFKKNIATGATNKTFETGDAANYAPVTIAFASVTTAGDLTASTVAGDHANIGSSMISPSYTVNRTWTLTNSGIVFTNYNATFTFVASDLDAGTNTDNFNVGKYSGGSWSYPNVGTKTSLSTVASSVTTFSDFQLGEFVNLPVRFTSIKAIEKNKDIQLVWQVAEESDIVKYEIRKSTDGFNFIKAGEVMATGREYIKTYQWVDIKPVSGSYYYNIRAVEIDSKYFLSNIVVAKINAGPSALTIFPNPVKDRAINIQAGNMQKGKYSLQLINQQGQPVFYRTFDHAGGFFNHIISLDETLPVGIFYLLITGEKEKHFQSIVVN